MGDLQPTSIRHRKVAVITLTVKPPWQTGPEGNLGPAYQTADGESASHRTLGEDSKHIILRLPETP